MQLHLCFANIFEFIITLKDLSIHPINEQFNFNIQNGDSGRQAWQNYREKVHVHSSTVNNMYSLVGVHKIYFQRCVLCRAVLR